MSKKLKHSGLKYKSYSKRENTNNKLLYKYFKNSPVNHEHILDNVGLYFNSKFLSRILTLNEIYKMILDTEGVILDIGVRWGQNLSVFTALRAIYEPYNIKRRIVGFDTFKGFPHINDRDKGKNLNPNLKKGNTK